MSEQPQLWDDPEKDYRQRYQLPEQFMWDTAALPRIRWDGYMSVVLDLLLPPPLHVFDVGCGTGMGSQRLVESGYTVEGIDYNERGIAFSRLMVPQGQFNHADARLLKDMPQYHGRFDAAIIVEVFEHIPPQYHPDVLQGIHAALKPDGVLVLSVPSVYGSVNKWDYRTFTLSDLIALVEQHGFRVEESVLQDRLNPITSKWLWRLLSNRIYDFRLGRQFIRQIYLQHLNTTSDEKHAGRLIIRARK